MSNVKNVTILLYTYHSKASTASVVHIDRAYTKIKNAVGKKGYAKREMALIGRMPQLNY